MHKSKLFFQVIISSLFATLATALIVSAATTIGANISTAGTLSVTSATATSTFSTGGLTVGTNQFVVQQSSGNVGIGTTTPGAKLTVTDGSVLFIGTTGATPVSGTGTRLMWIPEKAAFRAGIVDGAQWDDANIGLYSIALGQNNTATGTNSVVIGRGNTASSSSTYIFGEEIVVSKSAYPMNAILGYNQTITNSDYVYNLGDDFNVSGGIQISLVGYNQDITDSDYVYTLGEDLNVTNGFQITSVGYENTFTGITDDGIDNVNIFGINNTITQNDTVPITYSNILGNSNAITGSGIDYALISGNYNLISTGDYAHLFGSYLQASSTNTIVLGMGVNASNRLSNSITNSIMFGMNSTLPTMTITGGSGAGTLGLVGIGTTTPNNILDIYSTTKSALGFSGASGSTYKWTLGLDVTNGGRFSIASSTALGTLDRLVIDGSGRVGIGTSTPTAQLQITNSSSNATTTMEIGKTGQNKGSCLKMYDETGTVKYVTIRAGSFVISDTNCQ